MEAHKPPSFQPLCDVDRVYLDATAASYVVHYTVLAKIHGRTAHDRVREGLDLEAVVLPEMLLECQAGRHKIIGYGLSIDRDIIEMRTDPGHRGEGVANTVQPDADTPIKLLRCPRAYVVFFVHIQRQML